MILTGTISEAQNPNIRTQEFIDKKRKHIYFLCDRKSNWRVQNIYKKNNIKVNSRIVRITINSAIDISYAVNQVCKIKVKFLKLKVNGRDINQFIFQDLEVLY